MLTGKESPIPVASSGIGGRKKPLDAPPIRWGRPAPSLLRSPPRPDLPVTQPPHKKTPRFTVSFVGIVGTLLGITAVASVGIPLWFGQPRITLQSAAELLASDMQDVRQHAILTHVPCRIEFDADGGGYAAVNKRGNALPAPMGNGDFRRDYASDAVFRGVTLSQVDFGGTRALKFDRFGSAIQEGEIVLSYNGETRTVRFDTGTAYVLQSNER